MKKIFISLTVLAVSAIVIAAVNANSKLDNLFESNVEALADPEGSVGADCHYINGYTKFGSRAGGAYDCCAKWISLKPSNNKMCK